MTMNPFLFFSFLFFLYLFSSLFLPIFCFLLPYLLFLSPPSNQKRVASSLIFSFPSPARSPSSAARAPCRADIGLAAPSLGRRLVHGRTSVPPLPALPGASAHAPPTAAATARNPWWPSSPRPSATAIFSATVLSAAVFSATVFFEHAHVYTGGKIRPVPTHPR